ncbi:outer membrane assembly protein BamC [Glaciecola punicea]|jgi:outer membrane protein assembly factor BamC|uniref:outer membrane protein assembly factor BamC n=1 Tax=Glaciecola punicea TaxID=56804 RepID=UPI0008723FEA|nr:outer membrane protein assembly factor BamC [Glaciecola punicea]OFA33359.1 outer membrane assembly protein BamC [Glaciecola punicea]
MKNNFIVTIFAALALSACSSPGSRERTSGDFEYMKVKQQSAELKIPEELERPQRSNRYDLPTLASSTSAKALLGRDVRISSPRLVLPLVAGSHVEEGNEGATVMFDQVDDNRSLDKTIWDKVLSYLEQNNIGVESFDRDNNTLTTDWVISVTELDSSWYTFSSDFIEQAKKFKLSLNVAPHGRTASLTNEIVDYVDENGSSIISKMDPITQRTNEVDFLNYIIEEYDFGVRLAMSERIEKIRDGFGSELGVNADGDPAVIINAEYNDAWPRLLLVLRKMGFDVIDLDQSSGIMFVLYGGVEDGFWSGLFSKETLPLEKDNYRIFVKRAGSNTSITFKSDENVNFDAKQTSDIFPVFQEYMASNNLDI